MSSIIALLSYLLVLRKFYKDDQMRTVTSQLKANALFNVVTLGVSHVRGSGSMRLTTHILAQKLIYAEGGKAGKIPRSQIEIIQSQPTYD